jgi:hypothetical protein
MLILLELVKIAFVVSFIRKIMLIFYFVLGKKEKHWAVLQVICK